MTCHVLPLPLPLLLLLLLGGSLGGASAAPASAALDELDATYACFMDQVDRLRIQDKALVPGPLTLAFFFEQLADPACDVAFAPAREVCAPCFADPYARAFALAHGGGGRRTGNLAMPGTWGLDSESRVINIASRLGRLEHVLGHNDITVAALARVSGEPFDGPALRLLGRSAQAPDLYLWAAETAHAHTQDAGDAAPDAVAVELSRRAFILHVRALLERVERLVAERDDITALFVLGVALHGMQDLVYHRGMTFAEHAGLAYYLYENPDVLPEPAFGEVFARATVASARLLEVVRRRMGDAAWGRLGRAAPEASYREQRMAEGAMEGVALVSFADMARYWRMSWRYRFGGKERQAELAAASGGRWAVEPTVDAIVSSSWAAASGTP
jgi:hypothetical protein